MSEGLVCIFTFSFSLSVNTYTLTFIHSFIQKKILIEMLLCTKYYFRWYRCSNEQPLPSWNLNTFYYKEIMMQLRYSVGRCACTHSAVHHMHVPRQCFEPHMFFPFFFFIYSLEVVCAHHLDIFTFPVMSQLTKVWPSSHTILLKYYLTGHTCS